MSHRVYILLRCGLIILSCASFLPCRRIGAGPKKETGHDSSHEFKFSALRMGTEFNILLYAQDQLAAQRAALAAFDRVEELENIMSDYRRDSEVTHLCLAPAGTRRVVTPELFYVLETALRISRLSGGAFDVSIGPVVRLWREARARKQLPSPAEISNARRLVGYNNIVLDPAARTVILKLSGMKVDLGGIGKGYAADEALEVLKSRGFARALVQGGGEVAAGGAPPGKSGWKIAIRKLDPSDAVAPRDLVLHDCGISTSADFFQYLEINGTRYSHIINPSDGMGLRDSQAVTVVARNGITADALATTLAVMPVTEGLKLIEALEGTSAVITSRGRSGFQHFYSSRFPKGTRETEKTMQSPKTQRNRLNGLR